MCQKRSLFKIDERKAFAYLSEKCPSRTTTRAYDVYTNDRYHGVCFPTVLVVNPFKVNIFAALLNCTPARRASDLMKAPV